jgi:hypothetical protein
LSLNSLGPQIARRPADVRRKAEREDERVGRWCVSASIAAEARLPRCLQYHLFE